MSEALDLAKNLDKVVEMKKRDNSSRFHKGDPRAIAAGKKGGQAPKATGSRTGRTYQHKGFEMKWDKTKNLWVGKHEKITFYERSHHDLMRKINEWSAK